jgi:molybdopterin/thiamine biosynthesis adenylyltransferase
MKPKWIKTPDGRSLRRQPNKLALFLQQNVPPPATIQDLPVDAAPAASHGQPDYSTPESDLRKVAGCEVTLFGAGSVGSYMGFFLGIGGLTLNVIDCKRVEYKHVQGGRTAYDSTQVGMMKVDALKQKIEAEHLGASVRPYPFGVAELTRLDLKDMIERSWVVLLVIDDPDQILRISDLAYPVVEVIQAAMHTQGASGHIALSMPLVTPCLRCTLGISDARDIRRLDSEPANSLDIITLAQQAARFALDIVYSKASGRPISRWDTTKNLIYLSNRIDEFSPAGPGLHYEASQKRPDCAICHSIMPR